MKKTNLNKSLIYTKKCNETLLEIKQDIDLEKSMVDIDEDVLVDNICNDYLTLLDIKKAIDLEHSIIAIDNDSIIHKIYDEYLKEKGYTVKIFNLSNNEIITKEDLIRLKDRRGIYLIKSTKILDREEKKDITEKILNILVKEKIDFTNHNLNIFN